MDDITSLKEKIIMLAEKSSFYGSKSGEDIKLNRFLTLFPKNKLDQLNMEQYVLGEGSIDDNFCRWIERELESSLGRYMPGTSKGHMIYRMVGGELYKLNALKSYDDTNALRIVLQLTQCIANADVRSDLAWLDDDKEIARRAKVPENVTVAAGRKLRILQVYNPSFFVPVSSVDHLSYFLQRLGVGKEDVPSKAQAVAMSLMLGEKLAELQKVSPGLTPYCFMKVLYSDELSIRPVARKQSRLIDESFREPKELVCVFEPDFLNQILYGPPGTGKTYATTDLAVKIVEREWYEKNSNTLNQQEFRDEVKSRYDKLVKQGQIKFVTFHQSFSYEDFIEGIRANSKEGQITYDIEDGVFKSIADAAINQFSKELKSTIDLEGRQIWKMSLGNTLAGEDYIYDDCIDNGYASLGYGWDINFTGCSDRESVNHALQSSFSNDDEFSDYAITAVDTFINRIAKGDLILVSDGNSKIRAIGEVTSDYFYDNNVESGFFHQKRKVSWHRVFEPSLPREALLKKALSQMTIYNLNRKSIELEQLQNYLSAKKDQNERAQNYVLIIDEINRGNVSRIFGEAITLLEPDKRAGAADQRSVELPYSKTSFSIPQNLYLIGTMNTADKSLAHIDLALRRRFEFIEHLPDPSLLSDINIANFQVSELLAVINERIEVLLDREHLIGHSYFWSLKSIENDDALIAELASIFEKRIIPLLQEYFYSDWERITWVLNDHNKPSEFRFIHLAQADNSVNDLFGEDIAGQLNDRRYAINHDALVRAEAYALTINESKLVD